MALMREFSAVRYNHAPNKHKLCYVAVFLKISVVVRMLPAAMAAP